ncbi:uncharacterized protein LOC121381683 [Gigantopelta aegis]|uniref:uncharacterized protein LOC121381683 n=1 Tax=Gigantopelta aegis TaxID=1735272 RepID=UPI001B887DA9|nr:uncharacterized protein LOC121381683 [Gigantopelta aegis]XP_041366971.1 uncharacterized protein LOC121381683 [Gigantopelta aegis]
MSSDILTISVFVSLFLNALGADETCKFEFNVPTNGGCVVHTKEMELSYEQMKEDIASSQQRTRAMAESFTKEIGVLHQKSEEHHERLTKASRRLDDIEDSLKVLPQITQELAEVSKSLTETRRTVNAIHNDHDMFGSSIEELRHSSISQARNLSELSTEMSEHRIALMSYGVAIDKMKAAEDTMKGLEQKVAELKHDLVSTRNVVSELNEKVNSMETSIKSTIAAMASLGRLPGLVKRLQEQMERRLAKRRRRSIGLSDTGT